MLYSDAYAMKDYENAVEPIEWLLENTPNLNKSIYIRGAKIYRNLAKAAESDSLRDYYQDRQLEVYDQRVEYFCQEKKVRQRQAQYAFGYWINRGKEDRKYYEKLYNMYDNVYKLAGEDTKRTNLTYYMQMTKIMHQLKKIDDVQVLENYDNNIDAIDKNLAKQKEIAEKLDSLRAEIPIRNLAGSRLMMPSIRSLKVRSISTAPLSKRSGQTASKRTKM